MAQVTAQDVARLMREELRERTRLERAESLAREQAHAEGGSAASGTSASLSPDPSGAVAISLPMGAEAGRDSLAWPVHGARKPRRTLRSNRKKGRKHSQGSFSVSTALSQSVQGGSPYTRSVGTSPPSEEAALGFGPAQRRGSAPPTPTSRVVRGSSVGGLSAASLTSVPVHVPSGVARSVVDYTPLGCVSLDGDATCSSPRRSIMVDGYSTGGTSVASAGFSDAVTYLDSEVGAGVNGSVGLPQVVEVLVFSGESCTAAQPRTQDSDKLAATSSDEDANSGSPHAPVQGPKPGVAWRGSTGESGLADYDGSGGDGGDGLRQPSHTELHVNDSDGSGDDNSGGDGGDLRRQARPSVFTRGPPLTRGRTTGIVTCRVVTRTLTAATAATVVTAAPPLVVAVAPESLTRLTPPMVCTGPIDPAPGPSHRSPSCNATASIAVTAPPAPIAGTGLAVRVPRTAPMIWDDVVDAHVPDEVLAELSSGHSFLAPPLSPVVKGLKEAPSMAARCGLCTKRLSKRVKSATAPGTWQSRVVYEQLKWAPIFLGMLLVLVPLSLDGATLNRVTFSVLFHGIYFLMSTAFAFCAFSILYPLPPTRHLVAFIVCITILYTTSVGIAMAYLSGRRLVFVLPAILMFASVITMAFQLNSAISTCVVPVTPPAGAAAISEDRTPTTWDVLVGRVPIHTRERPVVVPGGPLSRQDSRHAFVLNAEALLPLRQLFIAFGVVAVSYYWFQVYTRVLAFDLNAMLFNGGVGQEGFGIATVLVFELALFGLRRFMRYVVARRSLVRVGIPDTSARAISTIMSYSVVLAGAYFERLLFVKFDSLAEVQTAVIERMVVHLLLDLVTMSRRYYTARNSVIVGAYKCATRSNRVLYMRDYNEYLYDQHVINMFAHVANFTSLATWGVALTWFRYGYNSPVFAFARLDMTDAEFLRLLSYGLVLALGEFGELVVVRVIACCGRQVRLRYFNRALLPLLPWASRLAFVVVAAHAMQDAMVALVQLEPSSWW